MELLEAFLVGGAAQSSLLLSGLVVYWVTVPRTLVGILAGLGAGSLLASIAFDLTPEATADLSPFEVSCWMLLGAAVLLAGDLFVEKRFGTEGTGGAMGIVVGSVVDGVPESLIFGITIAAGDPISAAFVAAVFVSNVPQALAPSSDLAESGWSKARTARLWLWVVLACAAASGIGWIVADHLSSANGARAAALASGGILAMLTNSLMPFAFERGRALAGVGTVIGFCLSLSAS